MEDAHIKLAQDKAKWDAEQEKKRQDLLTAKKVVIKGIDIPFWDLVSLLVKISFAAIPAAIIVAIIWGIIMSFLSGLVGIVR
ncbi:MAG: hypothetical protein RBR67_10195 [Desulfobacterium sp.]|jgi:hypothetical protein|nr:hypothetical protein [Desulfobacterium sp.]